MYGQSESAEPTPAGWYDDPQVAGTKRYWDGDAWTDHTASGYDTEPAEPAQRVYQHSRANPAFAEANRQSLGALAFAVVLMILGQTIGISFLGIFPVFLAYQAFRAREPLGPAALVLTVGAVLVGLVARGAF